MHTNQKEKAPPLERGQGFFVYHGSKQGTTSTEQVMLIMRPLSVYAWNTRYGSDALLGIHEMVGFLSTRPLSPVSRAHPSDRMNDSML